MQGMLSLKKDMKIEINTKRKEGKSIFTCKDVILFENAQNYSSSRYLLSNEKETFMLDVQKDVMQNISLTYYKLIEEMAFDLNFLSLVGTSPLGYHNPNIPNIDYVLYEKLESHYEDTEVIKFMVSEDELPQDPESMGYHQDGNGHWYFMSERSKGALLKFEDDYKLSWVYKQEKDERLLRRRVTQRTAVSFWHRCKRDAGIC